jgi:uncharacterized membrane protein YoaK (UPF0700 family)
MTNPVLPVEPLGRAVGVTATLSFVAGYVDVVGFIALFGLFTAHVTGNFILIGSELVHPEKTLAVAKLLALPVFIAVVVLTRLAVLREEKRGRTPWHGLLVMQMVLLTGFMLAGATTAADADPNDLGQILAGLLGVAAMGVQNAGTRLILANHAPTTLMTGNLTQAIIDLVDIYRVKSEESAEARDRVKRLAPSVLAFAAGALVGAYAYVAFSYWCLILPILALFAVMRTVSMRAHAPAPDPLGRQSEEMP